jgi:hypothetical protein
MTSDREKNEKQKPPPHGNSGEGTASIVPHLPARGQQQQQPQSTIPKLPRPEEPAGSNASH